MAEVDPELHANITTLKQGLEDHGLDVPRCSFKNGMLDIKIVDPADKRAFEFTKSLAHRNIFADLTTQIQRVYGWTSDDTYKATKMAEFRAMQEAWIDRRDEDPNWDPGAYDRARKRAETELANNRMVTKCVLLDQEMAFGLIIDHAMANRARGLEDDPDISMILNHSDVFVKQRRRSKAHGKRLSRPIADGRWKLTHQGIAIADDGFLLDGQHRVMEVFIKGLPIAIMITYNAPDDIFPFIDTGKRRSPGDVLYMQSGIKSAGQINTVIKLLHDYDTTRDQKQWHKTPLDPDQVADLLVEKYINVIEAYQLASRVAQHANVYLTRIAIAATTFVALRAWPQAPIEQFWNSSRGRGPDPYYHKHYAVDDFENHPAAALQQFGATWDKRLTNAKRQTKGQKNTEHFVVSLRAWNAACKGETKKTLGYDERHRAPDPYTPSS